MALRASGQTESKASQAGKQPPGLLPREMAVDLISAVLDRGRSFDEAFAACSSHPEYRALSPSDRGLARLITATVLRRHGQLAEILGQFIERPLPKKTGRLTSILMAGAAQLVFLGTPPHAVINLAVEQTRRDARARRFDRLTNAVLRRVAERGREIAAGQDPVRLNVPAWLLDRWTRTYGEETARRIAEASLREAPLDITAKANPEIWAERLGGVVLPTGSIRLIPQGRIENLPGFNEGAWWVQDAAAALPAKLLGDVSGKRIADLCAAPGGKTAELAAAGAKMTAVEIDSKRIERLKDNLARLRLEVEVVEADVTEWSPGELFDAVLLDAPCLSTGTIRRHPDLLRLKRESDLERLVELQKRLLEAAAKLIKPGGLLVYCTCSLEAEEGPQQIACVLSSGAFERVPIRPGEAGIAPEWVTPEGDLRTFPFHLQLEGENLSGMDGFYAARLRRVAARL